MEGDTLVRKYYSEHECLNETLNTLLKACSQIVARDNVIQLPVTQKCKVLCTLHNFIMDERHHACGKIPAEVP